MKVGPSASACRCWCQTACVTNVEGSWCRKGFWIRCCAIDEGLLALRCRPAGDGVKPPHAVVNMNVGRGLTEWRLACGLRCCTSRWRKIWTSGVALREEAPNRREGRWLKTVVLNVVGKGVT